MTNAKQIIVKFPSRSKPQVKHTVTISRQGSRVVVDCTCQGNRIGWALRRKHCRHFTDPKTLQAKQNFASR